MPKEPTVLIGPTEDLRLSVSRLPGTTLFSVIADTFGHASYGMPPKWRRVIRDTAPPAAAATMQALLTSSHPWAPDSLALTSGVGTGGGTGTATSITDELDRIESDTLLGEVEHRFGSAVPVPWQHVAERPGEFLDTYRTLTRAVWDAFAPLWHQADALLGREVERIGVASVTGALDTVINDLGAPVRYADGRLHLPHPCPQHATGPGRRRFVLVPLVSGFGACTYSAEDPDLIWVGYPLPGLGRLAHRSTEPHPPPAQDRLDLVLGPVRATLLRHARRRPSVSEAASLAHITVSTATYHCDRLARSGLLRRLRHGREIRLCLTDDGAALLDLLA
ncbi:MULTISPECIES: hypothetical protein [unclassified Streptomyces]|uniref:hypothetical protein n=1 Tax=unclassified Streptomyces TaxID=2593676 RepID=UPI0035DB8B8F